MKYVIKFLCHLALVVAFVYMFYFQGQLGSYNFWEWCWTIVASAIGIGNFFLLGAATEEEGYEEKGYLIGAGFLDFLLTLSIWLMAVNIGFSDISLLLACVGVYILSSGINKFTFSVIFFTLTICYFFIYNSLSVWYAWVVLILCIIAHLTSLITIVINNTDEDECPQLELLGLIIGAGIFFYSLIFGGLNLENEPDIIISLIYLLIAIIASIRDNILMSFVSIATMAGYFVYVMIPWQGLFSLILIITTWVFCAMGMFVYYNYKKRMYCVIRYVLNENRKVVKQYNDLVDGYNALADYVGNGYGASSQSHTDYSDEIAKGGMRALGGVLMNGAIEVARILIGF